MAKYTPPGMTAQQAAKLRAGTKRIARRYAAEQVSRMGTTPKRGGGVLGTLGRFGEDIGPGLVGGTVKLGIEGVKATSEDIAKGRGVPGAAAWVFTGGRTPGPWAYKKLPRAEQRAATTQLGKAMITSIPGQVKMLSDPEAWYEHPGFQLLNLAALVLPAPRGAASARLSRDFRAANPGMSLAQANKAAVVETFHPGFMRAHGVEGGIGPRVITGKYGTAAGRMPSRQPTVRAAQRALDIASEKLDVRNPEAPFSASRRAQAAARRGAIRETRRDRAARQRLEEIVASAVTPTRRGRARRAAGLGGKVDPAVGAALVASLEGPVGSSVREAAELRIKQLNSVLEQNADLRPMRDAIDDLHTERQALADAGEDTADVDAQITRQQGALDFLQGKNVAPVTGSPIRDAVFKVMKQTVGNKRAKQSIKLWDARARAASPDDPGAWYTANIAGAQRMPAASFEPTGTAYFQRMAADQGGFYFPLQRSL